MNGYVEGLRESLKLTGDSRAHVSVSSQFPFRANHTIAELARDSEAQVLSIVCGTRRRAVKETLDLIQDLLFQNKKIFLVCSFPGSAEDPADIAAVENLLLFKKINGRVVSDGVQVFIVCRGERDTAFLRDREIATEWCKL